MPVDELAALAHRYAGDLALIDAGAERLAALEREAQAAAARYREAAQALSAQRRRAAQALDKAVNAELKPLKLDRASFSTEIASERTKGRTASIASSSGCAPIPARGRGR